MNIDPDPAGGSAEKPGSPDGDPQKTATAWHEAGHAVMALALGRPIRKISIVPSRRAGGERQLGSCRIDRGRFRPSGDWLEDEVLILLAGMVAESLVTRQYCRLGAGEDLRQARQLLGQRAGSGRQIERLEQRMLDKAEHLLSDPARVRAIQLIAEELQEKETISGRAARHFFQQAEAEFS